MTKLIGSFTGLFYIAIAGLVVARQYQTAFRVTLIFSFGSLGAFWAEYSTRRGQRLLLTALRQPKPTRDELEFAASHFIAGFIAAIALKYATKGVIHEI